MFSQRRNLAQNAQVHQEMEEKEKVEGEERAALRYRRIRAYERLKP